MSRRAWVRLHRLRTGVGRFRSAEIVMYYFSTRWCGYVWSDVFLSVMPLHDKKMASCIFMGFWMQPWSILIFCLKSTNRKTPWNGGSFRRILPQFDQAFAAKGSCQPDIASFCAVHQSQHITRFYISHIGKSASTTDGSKTLPKLTQSCKSGRAFRVGQSFWSGPGRVRA